MEEQVFLHAASSGKTQKSQRVDAGFSLVRRDRDSNSGTKIIGHSLAGCCITTLPPLQEIPLGCDRAGLRREGKNSEILSPTARLVQGVRILPFTGGRKPRKPYETQQPHEKTSFPRSIRLLRIDGVCPVHGSSCRQQGQDGANLLEGCQKGVLQQRQGSRMLQQVRCFSRRKRGDVQQGQVCWMLQQVWCFCRRQGRDVQQGQVCRLLLQGHGRSTSRRHKRKVQEEARRQDLWLVQGRVILATQNSERAAHGVALFLSTVLQGRPQGPNFAPSRQESVLCHGCGSHSSTG